MEKVFSVFKFDKPSTLNNKLQRIQAHGRVLKSLNVGEIVYVTNDERYPVAITGIISYGHQLDRIEPVMSCSIVLDFNYALPDHVNDLYKPV